MKRFLTKYKAWRARSKQRSLEKWEKERARGKNRFIFRIALYYGFAMIGMTNAYERFFEGAVTQPTILLKLLYYIPFGLVMGSFGWAERESSYKKALREAREKAAALNPTPSQTQSALPQGTPNT